MPLRQLPVCLLILAGCWAASPAAAPISSFEQSDLDAFMQKVVAKRDDNWKKFQQYVLDEREQVELRGPGKLPIWGERRDYTWYLRDGFFVRSPVRANGVTLSDEERRAYEARFLRREQARERRRVQVGPVVVEGSTPPPPPPPDRGAAVEGEVPTDAQGLISQTRQPQFVSSAYFLKFKFEEGKYAFVGRETIDGRELLKIEYYPAKLFSKEQNSREHRRNLGEKSRDDNEEAALEQMLNKVSLVTLWVEPGAHQIVKYDFTNVNLDFLPGAWLVRLNDVKASMNMHMPFPDVWLPKNVDMYFSMMLAVGEFDARYRLTYENYKLATTTARIK